MFTNTRSYLVKFDRIVVPMAKGQRSKLPLELAFSFGRKFGSEITALTIKEEMKELTWSDKVRIVTNAYHDGKEKNIKVVPRVRTAKSIKKGMLDELNGSSYDLMLIGTNRRTNLSGSLFGGLGDFLIKNSNISTAIFSIKGDEAVYRRILVPLAESTTTRRALAFALQLKSCLGAEIIIFDLRKYDAKKTHGFQQFFDNLGSVNEMFGPELKIVRGGGEVSLSLEVRKAIEQYGADLLAMGVRVGDNHNIRFSSEFKALVKENQIDSLVFR